MASLRKKVECLFNATGLAIYKLDHSKPFYITPDFIRSLHKELYAYYRPAAGNFRTPVYGAKVTSKTFNPVPPSQIRTRLLDLCEFMSRPRLKVAVYRGMFTAKIKAYKSLDKAAKKFWYAIFCGSYVHHQITLIHPFTGGNGRLARLLMSVELANHGMYRATFPPLLNEVIRINRNKYLDALEKADRGDILAFCIFLAEMHKIALKIEKELVRKKKVLRK